MYYYLVKHTEGIIKPNSKVLTFECLNKTLKNIN